MRDVLIVEEASGGDNIPEDGESVSLRDAPLNLDEVFKVAR